MSNALESSKIQHVVTPQSTRPRPTNRHEEAPRISAKEDPSALTIKDFVNAMFDRTGRNLQEIIKGAKLEIRKDGTGPLRRAYEFAEKKMQEKKGLVGFNYYDLKNFDHMLHIAVWMYTYGGTDPQEILLYCILNKECREIQTIKQVNTFRYPYTYALIHSAIRELVKEDKHSGKNLHTGTVLYRGVSIIPQGLQVGKSLNFQMLTSTSQSLNVALGFLGNAEHGAIFEFHGLIGTAIHWLSTDRHNDYNESEILIEPFQFTVESIEKRAINNKHDRIRMHCESKSPLDWFKKLFI